MFAKGFFLINITSAHTGTTDVLYSEHLKYKYMHVFKIYALMEDKKKIIYIMISSRGKLGLCVNFLTC